MGVAAIYSDNNFGGEITGLKVTSVRIIRQARAISSPVETGQRVFDNKVIEPAKVVVRGSVMIGMPGASHAVAAINRMIANRNFSFYSASNGEDCCNNLMLLQTPEIRDSDKYDVIEYELSFSEVLFIQGEGGATGDNSNSQNGGYIAGRSA